MVLPPPTATNASNRPSTAITIASPKLRSVGSTSIRSKISNATPASRSAWTTVSPGGRERRAGSINTSARRAPRSRRSIPTSRVTPEPNRTLEAETWKAVSCSIIFMNNGIEPPRRQARQEKQRGLVRRGRPKRRRTQRRRGTSGAAPSGFSGSRVSPRFTLRSTFYHQRRQSLPHVGLPAIGGAGYPPHGRRSVQRCVGNRRQCKATTGAPSRSRFCWSRYRPSG
jgi:hypothetical protein